MDSSRSAATTLSSQAVNQTSASSSEPSQETAANQSSSVTESAGETTDSSASISSSSTASQVFSSAPTKQATASAKSSPLIPVTRLAQLSSNVVDVSQWSQLVDAWKDASVDEINITADISNPTAASGALDSRLSGNIIVNGNGHSVNIGRAGFHTRNNTATSGTMYTAIRPVRVQLVLQRQPIQIVRRHRQVDKRHHQQQVWTVHVQRQRRFQVRR
ncbi:hypothetical protein WP50_02175 [Lactiplantibacillus plantarum]|nr:hypothetical protein WP50_02175 [Lactiplantibacillus plantarum]